MKQNPRAVVAYVAARLINIQNASSVYDHSQSRSFCIEGSVTASKVDIYDHSQGCQIRGAGDGNDYSLYHFGDDHQIDLSIKGQEFDGYDYGKSCHFAGTVEGNRITFYDYGEKSFYQYSI